jgi:flagella basal body P-ring formation protein FlgA
VSTSRAVLLALALGSALSTPAAWAGVSVRLPAEAVVKSDEISLGDLASIEGDQDLAQRLRQVRLGPAPAPGASHRLDARYLRLRLSEPGLEPERVDLHAPDHVVITRASQVLPGPVLIEAVTRQIQERLDSRSAVDGPIAVVALNRPGDLQVPAGAIDIAATFNPDAPVPGTLAATATVKVDGRSAQTIPLSFRLGRYGTVLVAVHAVDAKAAVGPNDWRLERRPTSDVPAGALSALPESADLEAARPIRAGDVLTPALVKPRLLVRRGQIVTLLLEGPGFRIVTQGVAVTDGRRGESLRVLNPTSKRETLGTIESAGLVRVPFTTARSQP